MIRIRRGRSGAGSGDTARAGAAGYALGLLASLLLACGAAGEGGLALARDRPLSTALRSLEVTRQGAAGAAPVRARFDPRHHSATTMHEAPDRDAGGAGRAPLRSGEVLGRWALGQPVWDAVGLTRQRSGGEARDGLWAHPLDGTLLRIEASIRPSGERLVGFYGFSDHSLAQARRMGVDAPVRFEVSVDGRRVHSVDVSREPGWREFALTLPDTKPPRARRLVIEISSRRDKWSHFVFDLWAEGAPGQR